MNSNQQSNALSLPVQWQDTTVALERADIVIIGNGIAGLTAALEARRYDPGKHIVIISDQPHPTIHTPALKQFAVNKLQREQLLAYPAGTERSKRIHVVNARVREIYTQSKYLGLERDLAFGYERLLIATGSYPLGLPAAIPGRDFDGVMTLHRLKDYLDLRRRLSEVSEAVVVGGGAHASETVMSLLHWGIRVHWLIRGKTFLSRMLDNTASEMVLDNMRRAGAVIHTETELAAVVGRVGTVAGVVTSTSEMIPCELVLCCTGARPALELAKRCTVPMQFADGILVDSHLRTTVQDIYAAGDVAALPNPQTGAYETRAQWYSAVTQGKIAGAMMVGHSDAASTTDPFGVPWHATHLGKLSMLSVGDPLGLAENQQVAIYTNINRGDYCRLAVVDDRLVGYLSIGTTQADGLSIKRLIDENISIRDIIKPLLKGNLNVRAYLAQTKVSTAQNLITEPIPRFQRLQTLELPDAETNSFQLSTRLTEVDSENQLQIATGKRMVYETIAQESDKNVIAAITGDISNIRGDSNFLSGAKSEKVTDDLPVFNGVEDIQAVQKVYGDLSNQVESIRNRHSTRSIWYYATNNHLSSKEEEKIS